MKTCVISSFTDLILEICTIVSLLLFTLAPSAANALSQPYVCDKYVATDGTNNTSGSNMLPWSLTYALAGADGQVKAGETICLKGGTYSIINALVTASGTEAAPIIFRNAPGERAILDPAGHPGQVQETLRVTGSYVWLWGLEISDSAPTPLQTYGIVVAGGTGVKIINCIVHDMGQSGFGTWAENTGLEIYGTYSYFNGRNTEHRGYSIYTQNATGSKLFEDNYFFTNFGGYTFHAYGRAGQLNNMTFRSNVSMDGVMMIGGESKANNLVWESNFNYQTPNFGGSIVYLGYSAGVGNAVVKDNIFPSGTVQWAYANQIQSMTGNLFRGYLYYHNNTPAGIDLGQAQVDIPAQFPQNTYLFTQNNGLPKLSGVRTFVRNNRYEKGRGNIVIYNFDGVSSTLVDLNSLGLKTGERYEIRDGQNYFGSPVFRGTYNGDSIHLPLTGTAMAAPKTIPVGSASGISVIAHSPKEFNFFTVLPLGQADASPGAPTNLRVTH